MKSFAPVKLAVIVLLAATAVWAQEFPRFETTFDYSYLRFAPAAAYTQGHSMNGGGGAFKVNITHDFGILMDLQGYGSTSFHFNIPANRVFPGGASGNAQGNLFTYVFGPQLKLRAHGVHPFAQVLFGAAHANLYGNAYKQICQPVAGVCAISSAPADDAFAMALGGGADIPVGHVVSIRPAEIDWLLTRFTNQFANANQNNFRYSAGVVFSFGGSSH